MQGLHSKNGRIKNANISQCQLVLRTISHEKRIGDKICRKSGNFISMQRLVVVTPHGVTNRHSSRNSFPVIIGHSYFVVAARTNYLHT